MRAIVVTNRRGVTARPAPFSATNAVRPVVQTAARDQFGNVILRSVGGAK